MLALVAIVLALAWLTFTYAGYPLVLLALARRSPRPVRAADVFPPLTVVVAVHNGAAELRRKLEETLAQEYPGDFELIVASDGSTDATVEIAESFAAAGVVCVPGDERRGKEAVQASAIEKSTGEILVFTDVSAHIEPGGLRAIVRPFADPEIGAVSSVDRVEGGSGESAYVRYEMALRRLESEAATLVGLSGSFFAVRRALCDPWPAHLASDFRAALESARRGLRAVSEPAAGARFGVTRRAGAEWERKVRTVRRGLAVLFAYRELLHPRFGRAALSLWGHKLLRFTSPFALLVLLAASALAAPSQPLAAGLLAAQLLGYAVGGLALVARPVEAFAPARIAGFFLLVNASTLAAWWHHARGRRAVVWEPTRR